MKGLKLFLATCFVVPVLNGAVADTAKNMTRATSTRNTTPVTNTRNTTPVKQRNTTTARTATDKNIVQRSNTQTSTSIKNRSTSGTRETSVKSRAATRQPAMTRIPARTANSRSSKSGLSRSATTATRESIMLRDFGKCKSVFFDCMDEFCANKDAQLKRCACSARTNEFKTTQKSLDKVEDKLLDFSQLLLKVNMDPADAAVINQETEGEKAYYETKDKTESKKALDNIAKKLNADFDSAGNNLSALSWSLNADAAFDSVDSLAGTTTTAKSGTALRNAALPICREMAAEVCSSEDISLVENSYNMAIEQDCNTVKKAYETQTQAARNKVLESSALLDMTRLNTYQDNNSDDILTCKSKMLGMLTNTNVCGTDLTKCLDISGRYINPTTGEAFLSADLMNLSKLIVRPYGNTKWSTTIANSPFVSYLNSKKKYIEPATKNCQDIADDVWDDFLEDALAQIKLAQNAKLEEIRQSCTTLLVECLDNAKTDLAEFDSRALSTFGVMSDKTANALCEQIKTSCSTVMNYVPDDIITPDTDWTQGVTDIAASETYNTIINTCREVGRDCIISSCKSITGNFGLCESVHGSVNRHSILTRASCWNDVYNCVAQAGGESLTNIHNILPNYGSVPQDLYETMYSNALTAYVNANASADRHVYDVCVEDRTDCINPSSVECYICRLTEQIWGNCKLIPDNIAKNPILIPDDPNTSTLLSWFAKNTNTQDDEESCSVSMCPAGTIDYSYNSSIQCLNPENIMKCDNKIMRCEADATGNANGIGTITVPNSKINCCDSQVVDSWGNCCVNRKAVKITDTGTFSDTNITTNMEICAPRTYDDQADTTLIATYIESDNNNHDTITYIFCNGDFEIEIDTNNNSYLICSIGYITIECTGDGTTSGTCVYKLNIGTNNPTYTHNINYFVNEDAYSGGSQNTANYCSAITNNTCSLEKTTTNEFQWNNANCGTVSNHWLVDFTRVNN